MEMSCLKMSVALAATFVTFPLADIMPTNSHQVGRCIGISNADAFPDKVIIGIEISPSRQVWCYRLHSHDCAELSYKFNTLSLYSIPSVHSQWVSDTLGVVNGPESKTEIKGMGSDMNRLPYLEPIPGTLNASPEYVSNDDSLQSEKWLYEITIKDSSRSVNLNRVISTYLGKNGLIVKEVLSVSTGLKLQRRLKFDPKMDPINHTDLKGRHTRNAQVRRGIVEIK
jgi:hypothetical protein